MADGGSHFNNKEVQEFCTSRNVKTLTVAAYSPWVNGLVEGTNKLLLHILKRLCAPDLDANPADLDPTATVPCNWPDHLDAAIEQLNCRILPAFHLTLKEILLGLPKWKLADIDLLITEPSPNNIAAHMVLSSQVRLDRNAATTLHTQCWKAVFDACVLLSHTGPVTFQNGDLVQVYRNDLDFTFRADRKLIPKWSEPCCVTGCTRNSYTLESLLGIGFDGRFHARRLRRFHPRPNTLLALEESQRTHPVPALATPVHLVQVPSATRLCPLA